MLGIITEYNPFHNGHLFHINKSKELTKCKNCIVVMSGNFVQRGEPAIFDKFLRTKMALLNGADIVLELPLQFATSSAENFAMGAIDLLEKTGIVDKICFGTENGDLEILFKIAKILAKEDENYKNMLYKELKKGISFPKARQNVIESILKKDVNFLSMPNNILAIEYLKALIKLNSKIKPFTIKRQSSLFHSKEILGAVASATAIRLAFKENRINDIKKCIPKNCYDLICGLGNYKIPSIDDYSSILNYILKTDELEKIRNISEISEGIENRILKNSDTFLISELIEKVISKRYTKTRIQRAFLSIILQKTKEEEIINKIKLNQYIRVLGFKKESVSILNEISKKSNLPIITNLKKYKSLDKFIQNNIEKSIMATDIYNIGKNKIKNYEFYQPIIVL